VFDFCAVRLRGLQHEDENAFEAETGRGERDGMKRRI
jgi:hypothetical protein